MTAPQPQPVPYYYSTTPPADITYEQYLAEQAAILAALAALLLALSLPFQAPQLDGARWLVLLALMWPYVEQARRDAAILARAYYDAERARNVRPVRVPAFDLPRFDGPDGRPIRVTDDTGLDREVFERFPVDLPAYFPDWFEESMEAAKDDFSEADATDAVVARLVAIALKEVEQGGRKTILRAVDKDPKVIGWARVEGTENVGSCGFCAMLISRGPVYKQARDAGFDLDNVEAVEIFRQAEETGNNGILDELMNRWHENCDCKVVPVFDRANWQGREQYEDFEALWGSVTKGLSGKDALNAFRRAIESGETGEGLRPRRRTAA